MNLRKTRRLLAAVRVMVSIRAALGFERRDERSDRQTQPRNHLRQDVICEEAQAIGHQLHGDVSIAQVIGGLGDQKRIAAYRFEQGLLGRNNLDLAAIFDADALAVLEQAAAFDDERSLLPIVQPQQQSALAAGIESQDGAKRHDEFR
jgi:hypothetical protein